MEFRLPPKQAFSLYAVVLCFLFGFYVMGLLIGRGFGDAGPVEPVQTAPPAEGLGDLKNELGFLEELKGPQGSPQEDATTNAVAEGRSETGLERSPSPAEPPAQEPTFVVQVGALRTQEEAHQLSIRLKAEGFEVRLVAPDTIPGDTYFRVWVGGEFHRVEEARALEAELESRGIPYYTKRLN